jgi:hypothetical protein
LELLELLKLFLRVSAVNMELERLRKSLVVVVAHDKAIKGLQTPVEAITEVHESADSGMTLSDHALSLTLRSPPVNKID